MRPKPISIRRLGKRLISRQQARTPAEGEREAIFLQIVDAATELFLTRGYLHSPVEDIAHAMGLRKASLYYYIHSKYEILYYIVADLVTRAAASIQASARSTDDMKSLETLLHAHIDFVLRNYASAKLYVREYKNLTPEDQERLDVVLRHYLLPFEDVVYRGQGKGLFVPGDPKLIVKCLIGICNSKLFRLIGRPPDATIKTEIMYLVARCVSSGSAEGGSR